jgi:hypothetical protein
MYTQGFGHGVAADKLRTKQYTDPWEGPKRGYGMEEVFVAGGVDAYFAGMRKGEGG